MKGSLERFGMIDNLDPKGFGVKTVVPFPDTQGMVYYNMYIIYIYKWFTIQSQSFTIIHVGFSYINEKYTINMVTPVRWIVWKPVGMATVERVQWWECGAQRLRLRRASGKSWVDHSIGVAVSISWRNGGDFCWRGVNYDPWVGWYSHYPGCQWQIEGLHICMLL